MRKVKLLNMRAFYRYYLFSNILQLIMILYLYNLILPQGHEVVMVVVIIIVVKQ